MKDPRQALRTAAVTAIEARLTTESYTSVEDRVVVNPAKGTPEPYVKVEPSILRPWDTKTTEGAETSQLFVIWGENLDDVQTMANYVLQAISDRSSPLSVTGHDLIFSRCDDTPGYLEDIDERGTLYGVPIQVRHYTQEQ